MSQSSTAEFRGGPTTPKPTRFPASGSALSLAANRSGFGRSPALGCSGVVDRAPLITKPPDARFFLLYIYTLFPSSPFSCRYQQWWLRKNLKKKKEKARLTLGGERYGETRTCFLFFRVYSCSKKSAQALKTTPSKPSRFRNRKKGPDEPEFDQVRSPLRQLDI